MCMWYKDFRLNEQNIEIKFTQFIHFSNLLIFIYCIIFMMLK